MNKKGWEAACFKVLKERWNNRTLTEVQWDLNDVDPEVDLTLLQEEDEDVVIAEPSDPDPNTDAPMADDADTAKMKSLEEEAKRLMAEHVKRVHEEAVMRHLLAQASYLYQRPGKLSSYSEDEMKLRAEIEEFKENFMFDHMKHCSKGSLVMDLRLVTVETMLLFDYMHAKGWSPKELTRPSDKHIRWKAGEEISPLFSDPGNLQYDVLYHILRLDRFLDQTAVHRVIKVSATEYGSGRNKSAVGAVNLRGNIIEAILRELQVNSTESWNWRAWKYHKGYSYKQNWY